MSEGDPRRYQRVPEGGGTGTGDNRLLYSRGRYPGILLVLPCRLIEPLYPPARRPRAPSLLPLGEFQSHTDGRLLGGGRGHMVGIWTVGFMPPIPYPHRPPACSLRAPPSRGYHMLE